jgi:hypothetical protein
MESKSLELFFFFEKIILCFGAHLKGPYFWKHNLHTHRTLGTDVCGIGSQMPNVVKIRPIVQTLASAIYTQIGGIPETTYS